MTHLATLRIGNKEIHLSEGDRPVWHLANDVHGNRIVPTLEHFLADALIFFAGEELGIEQLPELSQTTGLVEAYAIDEALEKVRPSVYSALNKIGHLVVHEPVGELWRDLEKIPSIEELKAQ